MGIENRNLSWLIYRKKVKQQGKSALINISNCSQFMLRQSLLEGTLVNRLTENTEQYQNKCLNLWIIQIDLNTLPVQLEMSAPKSEDDFSGCSKWGHMFTDPILFLLVEIHTPMKFTHQYLMACEDRFFNPMLKLSIQHFHIFFCIFFKH